MNIPLPPTGSKLACKGWHQEAALRCLLNNLHPEVAENRDHFVVYGGNGKAVRDAKALEDIIWALKHLENDQTLLIQSGKPVAIFPSRPGAPRVLMANSNIVPKWANWDHFNKLCAEGKMVFGQMTAGSWIYIGTQGILQGTYETFMAVASVHYGEGKDLTGKLVLTAGLGGMGGAQPLAVKMASGVCLACDVSLDRMEKRKATKYLDVIADTPTMALEMALEAKNEGKSMSVACRANAADFFPFVLERGIVPDIVTDQTSAHDPLNGYVPTGFLVEEERERVKRESPKEYMAKSYKSMAQQVEAMVAFKDRGSRVFDYGNNIREGARLHGYARANDFPGFVPAYIRPLFCQGSGPFRWVALSGQASDIHVTDEALKGLFPENKKLHTWLNKASEMVSFQGLPSRICWFRYGEREQVGLLFNKLVREKKVKAPIVIGRDHLDGGSVASPNRETEGMRDGTDAVSDWPLLNLMINAINGASWVSFHHGGGVGMGYSQHAGMVVCADGTKEMDKRLSLVLNSDPGMGIVRHFDAGYPEALDFVRKQKIQMSFPSARTLDL